MFVRVYTVVNKDGSAYKDKVYLTRKEAREARSNLNNPKDYRIAYKNLQVSSNNGWNTVR